MGVHMLCRGAAWQADVVCGGDRLDCRRACGSAPAGGAAVGVQQRRARVLRGTVFPDVLVLLQAGGTHTRQRLVLLRQQMG